MPEYLNRADLLEVIHKAEKALDRGTKPDKVLKFLRAKRTQAEETTYFNREDHDNLVALVEQQPGITYTEAAKALGWDRKKTTNYVRQDHRLTTMELAEKKGMYGVKPHGIFLYGRRYNRSEKKSGAVTYSLVED